MVLFINTMHLSTVSNSMVSFLQPPKQSLIFQKNKKINHVCFLRTRVVIHVYCTFTEGIPTR